MSDLSYAEAYTEYIKYCFKKNDNNVSVNLLIQKFRDDGTEHAFFELYKHFPEFSMPEYYKKLKR